MLDALRLTSTRQPGAGASVSDERAEVALTDLIDTADRLAADLGRRVAGLRVAVALPSGPDCLVGVLALLSAGATVILCNHAWWPRDLRATLEVCGAQAVLGADAVTSTCRDLCPPLPFVRTPNGEPVIDTAELVPGTGPSIGAATQALLVPAGGTRAEPHAVAFDHDQIANWIAQGAAQPTGGPALPGVAAAPLLVTTELGHPPTFRRVIQQLAAGGSVRLHARWRPKHLLDELKKQPGSALWATGTQVDLLLARAGGAVPALSRVEAIGTPLFPAAAAALARGGVAAHRWYTSTEAGGWIGNSAADSLGRPPGGVRLAAGVEVLLDQQSHADGPQAYRELRVGGPAAGSRLDGSPTHWPVGDLARWLGDGDLDLRGRLVDRFSVGGRIVDPVEVESALRNHPAVAAVAVVPRPDDELGFVPVAVIVPTDVDRPPFLADLADHLATLPEHCHPRAEWVVDTLPLAPTGSLHRRLLAFEEAGR